MCKYLHPSDPPDDCNDLRQLYRRLLRTAQNNNMRSGVIGHAIGGFDKLEQILFDFDAAKILEHYQSWEDVFDQVKSKLQPRGKMRCTARSIWPRYCMTILSAAEFIGKFESADDFHEWVQFFDNDARARPALPMLLKMEIDGCGFALACDFLKELGYHNFAKPDVHIKDIFEDLELTRTRKDYDVFRSVVRVAAAVGETPFTVDKLFWLIGSGNFHKHPEIGNNGRIGNHKVQFLEYAVAKFGGKAP